MPSKYAPADPQPTRIYRTTWADLHMVARSHVALQDSFRLLNDTQHVTAYAGNRQHHPPPSLDELDEPS